MYSRLVAALVLAMAGIGAGATTTPYLHSPAGNRYALHNPEGVSILPNGRLLKPVGRHMPMSRWPHGLALSPDGQTVFVASAGVGQLITDWGAAQPSVRQIQPVDGQKRRTNAGGCAFSPDGKTLYWSAGETGQVYFFDVASGERTAEVTLNTELGGRKFEDSYCFDLKVSADGENIYCADVANFRVAVISVAERKVVGSVNVGRYPYALALAGNRVYVANVGMFEYTAIPAPDKPESTQGKPPVAIGDARDPRGISFPAFGFPSKEARDGVRFEGRWIKGLGDPNVPESFSVWGIDVADPARPRVVSKLKTGILVGGKADAGPAVGGSAPNFVAIYGNSLYVSDNNNDIVERVDRRTNRIVARVWLRPSPLTAKLRGVSPAGMAVSRDGRRVYVAECGINAIAVLDGTTLKMLGHIPTAWYPYRVAMLPDGKTLACICFRGFGNGPNAGKNIPKSPYLGMKGSLSFIPVPRDKELPSLTARVLQYNGMVDRSADRKAYASPVIPTVPGKVSKQIKYVVFLTKENHTYDAIFDRIPGAKHDPGLLRWGLDQTVRADGQPTLEHVAVMTNHNALARQFSVSDNFYMEPEASGVGHRWLIGVQPNNFCQMTYTLGWDFKLNTTAPGRLASFGSNGSVQPEDYPEAGSMWEHLARHNVSFRNYGEGFEFAGVDEGAGSHRTGAREVVNIPMSKVVFDHTCRDYPIFNMNIPDQYRAFWFEQDFRKRFLSGKQKMPQFINIAICNDHGAGPNPDRGYPYVASWMADNDLAMGRIIEFLSHTPYWKNMAIFVTEDDSGGEPDSVDAQRSVMMVISPWARRGYVSHRHTAIVSMHRTLYEIFGLSPLNLFDGLINDLSDCFTTKPDFRPYTCVPVDKRIFDPEKAKDPHDPDYRQARLMPSIVRDDEDEEEEILRLGQ